MGHALSRRRGWSVRCNHKLWKEEIAGGVLYAVSNGWHGWKKIAQCEPALSALRDVVAFAPHRGKKFYAIAERGVMIAPLFCCEYRACVFLLADGRRARRVSARAADRSEVITICITEFVRGGSAAAGKSVSSHHRSCITPAAPPSGFTPVRISASWSQHPQWLAKKRRAGDSVGIVWRGPELRLSVKVVNSSGGGAATQDPGHSSMQGRESDAGRCVASAGDGKVRLTAGMTAMKR